MAITQEKLTHKQNALAVAFATIGSKTYNNQQESARVAGYKGNDNTLAQIGHKMVNNGKVKARIDQIKGEVAEKLEVTTEFIIEKLLKGLSLAEQKGNLVAMARFGELLGKYKGIFIENIHTTTDQQRELDEKEEAEAKIIAMQRLRGGA